MNDRQRAGVWTVDPARSLQSVLDDPLCPPLGRRGLKGTHSWQIRNEVTVYRTLKASQLMPQWIAALLALGATVTLKGLGGSKDAPLDAWIRGAAKGEVAALHIPVSSASVGWGEACVARTPSDEPIVASFAVVEMRGDTVDAARVALTGVWSRAVKLAQAPGALVGGSLTAERIGNVAASIEKEVQPHGDYLGSAAYRRAMAGVLSRRAMEACMRQGAADE